MEDGHSGDDAVSVEDLSYTFQYSPAPVLRNIDISIPRGSRCLLIGANGAGKSTLLQVLAGKRMVKGGGQAKVLGNEVFFKTPPGVTYLGTEWANNPVVRSDLAVSHFIDSVGGWRHKDRRDRLLDILDVDLAWHMHAISDGERRRVQIVAGLMAPWDLLLLDEVTVDLDVLVRTKLLSFLKEETTTRHATVLYATHIFDGLDTFPTHICHLQLGATLEPPMIQWPLVLADGPQIKGIPSEVVARMNDPDRAGSRLLELAIAWLTTDNAKRLKLEEAGELGYRKRGSNATTETRDSEVFYRKYDYSH